MGGRMSTVAPEPRAPQTAHRRAEGPVHARLSAGWQARDGARGRPRSGDRRGEEPLGARSERYGAAEWSLSDVEEVSRLTEAHELAAQRGGLRGAAARQLAILSEVSVVGQEFGWPLQASPGAAGAGAAPKPAAGVVSDHAAGVFGETSSRRASSRTSGTKQRSGKDTAAELQRFLESRAGDDYEHDEEGPEKAGCLRTPAGLQGWNAHPDPARGGTCRKTRGRPTSAPLASREGAPISEGGTVEAQLRREIAASRARTHAHAP